MRPNLALFSECHELFGHPEQGELAAELAMKTMRRARKTGIWLGFDTQSSRKDAIPPKHRRARVRELLLLRQDVAVQRRFPG